jgi:hypothetical protein
MLPALAACTMLAVTAPVAPAKTAHVASVKSSLAKVSGALKALQKGVSLIQDVDKGQTGAINGVDARVTTVVANLKTLSDTVTAVVAQATTALTALQNGLLAINAALTNSTTGLVGLNLARPQFGAFAANGTILGGTGQVTGASGPKTNATEGGTSVAAAGGANLSGFYVVDFGNDVSKRMLSVNVFPYGGPLGSGAAPTSSAANCAASVGTSAICGLTLTGGAADTSPNHVLVQVGAGSASATNGFSVTAVSG